ncbi:MAG: RDD family protein [Alphaproteobacteria bacterium]|nr:RDD family protein [Alphaproteobacteria bacterium]
MTTNDPGRFDPKRLGVSVELKPHAYDPVASPELFEGVLARRVVAFLIDFVILSIPVVFVSMFIFIVGVVTFGLGFLFYGLLWPAMIIWAICYYGMTLGGTASATIGMRAMDIEMRTWYGSPIYFVLGAVHAVVFWVTVSALTPFVLLVCLFNGRRHCLHDILVGTVVINNASRTASLMASRRGA